MTSESLRVGRYVHNWDGRDDGGRLAGAGVYFVKLGAGATVDSRKLVWTQ